MLEHYVWCSLARPSGLPGTLYVLLLFFFFFSSSTFYPVLSESTWPIFIKLSTLINVWYGLINRSCVHWFCDRLKNAVMATRDVGVKQLLHQQQEQLLAIADHHWSSGSALSYASYRMERRGAWKFSHGYHFQPHKPILWPNLSNWQTPSSVVLVLSLLWCSKMN